MISGRTIAKNLGVMMLSQISTWGMAFVLAIFLPRYLGPERLGVIAIATAIWLIMGVLISFGMDTHLTKSVAREPEKTSEMLVTSLMIRTILFVFSAMLVAIYALIMQYDRTLITVLAIQGILMLFGTFQGAFEAAIVGLERMEFISLSNILGKAALTGLTLLLIMLDAGLYLIVAINIVTSIPALIILPIIIHRQYPIRFKMSFTEGRSMFTASSVYLLTVLTMVIYQQIDTLFIAIFADTKTVGWYETATRLFGTTMFLPVMFGTVIFPSLARSYASGDSKLNIIAQRSFDLMFLISVPVGFGIVVIAQPLVILIYGAEFAQTGGVLMILGVVLIFTYLNTILAQLLISVDRTGIWNIVMIVAILITLPIDFVLVPWAHTTYGNGALGGALAFLITEFGMVITAILLLPKNTLQWSNVRTAALTLFSGLLMIAASWWFRESMLILSVLVGAITYGAAVLVLRIIPREDFLLARDGMNSIIKRLRGNKEASAELGN
jgi:O-antigen/teichoic acid export membrane protein